MSKVADTEAFREYLREYARDILEIANDAALADSEAIVQAAESKWKKTGVEDADERLLPFYEVSPRFGHKAKPVEPSIPEGGHRNEPLNPFDLPK